MLYKIVWTVEKYVLYFFSLACLALIKIFRKMFVFYLSNWSIYEVNYMFNICVHPADFVLFFCQSGVPAIPGVQLPAGV